RGGAKYRPYAGRARRDDELGSTRSDASSGVDETSDTAIFGLCTGASEWTATPLFAPDASAHPQNLAEHMAGLAPLVLHPWTSARWIDEPVFWVTGDSARSADFTSITTVPSSSS